MATAGTMLVTAPASAASTPGASNTIALSDYGAVGNGTTDDTSAIQSALNAAQNGMTVLGDPSATYLISSTLGFPTDGVTLDLNGASVQIGAQRQSGSQLATNDTVLNCSDRSGVRITGGTLLSSLSAFSGSGMPYRIQICGGNGCRVDAMSAQCDGSIFAFVYGPGHQVDHNTIEAGSIVGADTTDFVIEANTLTNSPSDAITVNGYSGCSGTQYLDNVITGYGRIGIEDYSPGGPQLSQSPVFRGNQISAPASSAGTGISAMATGATISDNTITDARGWAIEANGLATTVTGNTLSWTEPSAVVLETTAIVINTSNPDQLAPVLVHANTITGPGYGIALFGDCFYCPVTIAANTVTNPLCAGVILAPAQSAGGVALINNTVAFTAPPYQGQDQFGIKTAQNALVQGNQVTWTPQTYAAGVVDTPYFLVGSDVTMIANVSDGGGRTDGQLLSSSIGGNYTGWTVSANQFIDGATVDFGGLTTSTSSAQSSSAATDASSPQAPIAQTSTTSAPLTSTDAQAPTPTQPTASTTSQAATTAQRAATAPRPAARAKSAQRRAHAQHGRVQRRRHKR